jgi:hypothetical protein
MPFIKPETDEGEIVVTEPSPQEVMKKKAEGRTKRVKAQAMGAESVSPEWHTHWALDKPARVRKLQNMGYQLVNTNDEAQMKLIRPDYKGWVDSQHNIRDDDLLLMIVKREQVEKREQERQMQNYLKDKAHRKSLESENEPERITVPME